MASTTIQYRSEEIFSVKEAVSTQNNYADVTIPQNPGLAQNDFNSGHQDSYASESVSLNGPTSSMLKLIKQAHPYGLTAIQACNSSNQMIAISGSIALGYHLLVYDSYCRIISVTDLGSISGLSFAGGYFFLNNAEDSVVCTSTLMSCYPTAYVDEQESVYALTPKWQTDDLVTLVTQSKDNYLYCSLPVWGYENLYWCVFAGNYNTTEEKLYSNAFIAVVSVVPDSTASNGCVTTLIGKEELAYQWNNNSIAVDEDGVYLVLNKVNSESGKPSSFGTLRKYVYDDTNGLQLGWVYRYESCRLLLTGQTNIGSGTTPTLTNDDNGAKLVAITDNASPQINVVVVDRITGTLVSKTPVFSKMRSADEASLIGVKDSFVVENNYGHTVGQLPQLVPNEPGMESISVNPSDESAQVVWNNSYTTFFGMSMLARGSGIIFGYTGSWYDAEASTSGALYSIIAIDSFSGRIIWSVPVGRGKEFSHEYGGFYFNHKGDLFVGTVGYLVSIQNVEQDEIATKTVKQSK